MGYTHGEKWTEDKIKEEIMAVVDGIGLNSMPTRSQIRNYFGDDRLTNKISKTKGYGGWARELGLPMQDNDTRKGKLSEQEAADFLQAKGFRVERMSQNYPFDLLVGGTVRIDVKTARLCAAGYFSFALRKRFPSCDIYMLIERREDGDRVYIVPSKFVCQTQLSLGGKASKYDRFIDRYDYIDRYLWLFNQIE